MKRLLFVTTLFAVACGTQGEGERCNPLRATSDCDPGLVCVYPSAPGCGVAYCCIVDSSGRIQDYQPSCQPDPSLAPLCGPDLGSTD